MKRLRAYRLSRLRAELAARDCAGILLYDPINIRYATGSRNMAVWTTHNPARYAYVPTDGPIVNRTRSDGACAAVSRASATRSCPLNVVSIRWAAGSHCAAMSSGLGVGFAM